MLDKYRVKCPNCGVKVEKLDFADIYSRCTDRFEEYVAKLCRITSVKQVANFLEVDWKTVKDIDKKYLKREFAIPDCDDLRILGIDEVSSKKGHHYENCQKAPPLAGGDEWRGLLGGETP